MEEKSRSTRSSHGAAETPLLCIMTPARVGENQVLQEPNPARGKENRRTGWKFNHAKNQDFRDCENEVLHGPNPLQPEKGCRRLEVSFMPVTKKIAYIPIRLCLALRKFYATQSNFAAGSKLNLRKKTILPRRPVHFARKCRAGHQPEAIL